jgi:hypothetical protein
MKALQVGAFDVKSFEIEAQSAANKWTLKPNIRIFINIHDCPSILSRVQSDTPVSHLQKTELINIAIRYSFAERIFKVFKISNAAIRVLEKVESEGLALHFSSDEEFILNKLITSGFLERRSFNLTQAVGLKLGEKAIFPVD